MRLAALLILAAAAPAVAGDPAVVSLEPRAEVTGVVYRLGDLATVSCQDVVRGARLRGIVIARTPPPGRRVRITRRALGEILSARDGGELRLEGARSVAVEARIARFGPEEIRDAARRFLEVKLGGVPGREVSVLATTPVVDPLEVPAGRETTELRADFTGTPRSRGEIRVTVRAVADGIPLAARVVTMLVRARAEVLVLVRDVRAGESIRAGDVGVRTVDVTDESPGLLRDPSELRRATARRRLAAGTPLAETLLRRMPDVLRGDVVELVYRRGALVVRTRAVAVEDGRLGSTVVVVNSTSGKRIHGRVAAPGVVEVGPREGGAR